MVTVLFSHLDLKQLVCIALKMSFTKTNLMIVWVFLKELHNSLASVAELHSNIIQCYV